MNADEGYAIARDGWLRPLLVPFTATASRSTIGLAEDGLHVQFGWYRTTIDYAAIAGCGRARWPWYGGLGWRTNFRSMLALVGSYRGVVKITLRPAHHTHLFKIGFNVSDLYLSVDEPDHFLRELERRATSSVMV